MREDWVVLVRWDFVCCRLVVVGGKVEVSYIYI